MVLANRTVVLFICCVVCIFNASGRHYNCPTELHNCTCNAVKVSCDLKGYTSFPEGLTMDYSVRDLSLKENNLTGINDNHFKNFIHINFLDVSRNQISRISENAFFYNTMLHTIYLSRNRLTSLPDKLFSRLHTLEDIYLEFNQLKVIKSAHFQGIHSLKRVRLHDNQLTQIGSEAFIDSTTITELYLENNQLQTPERNWLLHFDHTETSGFELFMDGNPWSCDCRMKEFYDWAISKNWFTHSSIRRITMPRCHEPPNLRGKLIASINTPSQLVCTGVKITSRSKNVSVFEGHVVSLECKADGVPTPIVSIVDPKGSILTSNSSHVKYILDSATTGDSGKYHCNAAGNLHSKSQITVDAVIVIDVHKHPASVVSIVFLCLLAAAVLLVVMVWYVKKYRPKVGYGRLPNNGGLADEDQIASYARDNAQSMRVSLSQSSDRNAYKTAISSHMAHATQYDDDDEVTEYHKDTEYLV